MTRVVIYNLLLENNQCLSRYTSQRKSALVLQKTYQYITSQHAQMLVGDPEFINYVSAKAAQKQQRNPDIHKLHPYISCKMRSPRKRNSSWLCRIDPFASAIFLFLII